MDHKARCMEHKARCMEHKARQAVFKHQDDLKNIKNIKLDKLQKAVAKAYIVLLQIGDKFKGHAKLPINK